MPYHITYLAQSRLIGSETQIDMSFSRATEQAVRAVQSGVAERAEVRDDDGRLLYHFPRVLRRA